MSLDSAEKNAEFAASMKTQIPVVSDPDGETAERYGVIGFGGLYSKRWTFYIDRTGTLREIDKDVKPESAGQDILATLERLGFEKRSSSVGNRELTDPGGATEVHAVVSSVRSGR